MHSVVTLYPNYYYTYGTLSDLDALWSLILLSLSLNIYIYARTLFSILNVMDSPDILDP